MIMRSHSCMFLFFFNDTATTEIYTLSLHDALPILSRSEGFTPIAIKRCPGVRLTMSACSSGSSMKRWITPRSEEHTSELQSRQYLVCRLLLEKKNHITHSQLRHHLYSRTLSASHIF